MLKCKKYYYQELPGKHSVTEKQPYLSHANIIDYSSKQNFPINHSQKYKIHISRASFLILRIVATLFPGLFGGKTVWPLSQFHLTTPSKWF